MQCRYADTAPEYSDSPIELTTTGRQSSEQGQHSKWDYWLLLLFHTCFSNCSQTRCGFCIWLLPPSLQLMYTLALSRYNDFLSYISALLPKPPQWSWGVFCEAESGRSSTMSLLSGALCCCFSFSFFIFCACCSLGPAPPEPWLTAQNIPLTTNDARVAATKA